MRIWRCYWPGYGKGMGLCLWQDMRRMTLLHFSLPKVSSICFFGFA